MNRAYGSLLFMAGWINWTKVQPYKMCRASGSYLCEKSRRDGVFCSNGFQSVGIGGMVFCSNGF